MLHKHRYVISAALAMALVAIQFAALRFAPSEAVVRVVLPATLLLVPVALWAYSDRIGVWVLYLGLVANLAPILANGGLMPIERSTIVEAAGEERAAAYETGEWIRGSKDMLVAPGEGQLTALGDSIVIRFGDGGAVVSPGDLIVAAGLLVVLAEVSLTWQTKRTWKPVTPIELETERGAEGGAAA